jgi:SAM-dependent methyltransferase
LTEYGVLAYSFSNPQTYWELRWQLQPTQTSTNVDDTLKITEYMKKHDCHSILEIGCGLGENRNLEGYLGLDFSLEALRKSKLKRFIYADLTEEIPLSDKSFDCFLSREVLLHISHEKIGFVANELERVTRKVGIVREPEPFKETQPHCFNHDLPSLFKGLPLERLN